METLSKDVVTTYNKGELVSTSELLKQIAYTTIKSGQEAINAFRTSQETLDGKLTINKAMLTLMFYENEDYRRPIGKSKAIGFSRFMDENFKGYNSKQTAYNDLAVAFLIKFGSLDSCLADIRGIDNLSYSQLLEIAYAIPRAKDDKGNYCEALTAYQARVHGIIENLSQEVGTSHLNNNTTRKELAEMLKATKETYNPQAAKAKANREAKQAEAEAAQAKLEADEARAKTDEVFAAELTAERNAIKAAENEFIKAAKIAHLTFTQSQLIDLIKAFCKEEKA